MDKIDRVLTIIQELKVSEAVSQEKLTSLQRSVDKYDKTLEKLEKRVDRHDKIVGAIVIAFTLLGVMIKFKLI